MSNPPLATKAILIAALPALLRECAIFPPSSFDAARVWKVLHFDGKVGDDRDEPYSTAILGLVRFLMDVEEEVREVAEKKRW